MGSQPMSLAGCGLRRFEAKMAEIHLFQTKSHTRRSLFWLNVAMREPLLACGVLSRDKVDTENGAMEEP